MPPLLDDPSARGEVSLMTVGDGIAIAGVFAGFAAMVWAVAWCKVRAGQQWTDIAIHTKDRDVP